MFRISVESHMIQSVYVVNHPLRMLNNLQSMSAKFCFLSSWRYYCIASRHSQMQRCQNVSIHSSTRTRPTAVLSATRSLHVSHGGTDADAGIDASSAEHHSACTQQSSDVNSNLHSQGSDIHTPVMAEDVVRLIAPCKGQVCTFS